MGEAETPLAEETATPAAAGNGDAETLVADAAPAEERKKKSAKDSKGKEKKGKESKGKESKGKESKGDGEALPDGPSIAGHPRAVRSVARAKAWGALIGFTLGGYESLPTHTLADAGLRALAAGAILYVAVWAGAVFAWRRLVIVEIKAREAQLLAAAQAARARQQQGAGGAQGVRGPQGAATN